MTKLTLNGTMYSYNRDTTLNIKLFSWAKAGLEAISIHEENVTLTCGNVHKTFSSYVISLNDREGHKAYREVLVSLSNETTLQLGAAGNVLYVMD